MGRVRHLDPWIERTTYSPRLFTGEAWAALSDNQRQVIQNQRAAVVRSLAAKHDAQYHGAEHTNTLDGELRADLRDTSNGGRPLGP